MRERRLEETRGKRRGPSLSGNSQAPINLITSLHSGVLLKQQAPLRQPLSSYYGEDGVLALIPRRRLPRPLRSAPFPPTLTPSPQHFNMASLAKNTTPALGFLARYTPLAARRTNPRTRMVPLRQRKNLHDSTTSRSTAAAQKDTSSLSSNPQLSFPCLDSVEDRTRELNDRRGLAGPEPSYTTGHHETFHSAEPLHLDWGGVLPSFDLAWEAWGTLNADKSNAILLHTGLSPSSHAHSTPSNPQPGWWERFIGPGAPLDTDRFFIVCSNVLGGCYGSTGPASVDPASGARYATRFPILTLPDMVRAQLRLLDAMGITHLHASVGASMGGMQALAAGMLAPARVRRIVSISACARTHPAGIAMRHAQRQVLMNDARWAATRGDYYASGVPPHAGMKLARQIATITYRSGPEWEARFGRARAHPHSAPALCPDFLIETYLDHAGEKWCLQYDANSLLYISKAMDLFDLGHDAQAATAARRAASPASTAPRRDVCTLQAPATSASPSTPEPESAPDTRSPPSDDLVRGLAPLRDIPALVLGVASDQLFPAWQQRELADALRRGGNRDVTHVELGEERSLFGHDTFLLDLEGVGGEIGKFLA